MLKVEIPKNPQGIPQIALDKMEAEVYNRYVLLGMLDTATSFNGPQLTSLGKYIDSQ
jgi:hypothetical protein